MAYRYTTPTLPLTISDLDFSTVNKFRIAIEQGDKEIFLFIVDASDPIVDAEHKTIYLELTQEQTSQLSEGYAKIQIRVLFTSGKVLATPKKNVTINDVIDEVIV